MQIAIIVICCLMPCIGLVLGLLMLMKGKSKLTDGTKPGGLPGKVQLSFGRVILCVAFAELVLTLAVLFLAPVTGTKPKLILTILVVTVQYATAMILIFVLNARMPHSPRKKQEKDELQESVQDVEQNEWK